MVFNATFKNNSVILLRSVLLYEETRVPGENHWPVASHWQTLSHNVASSTPHHERDIYICFWNSSFLPKIEPSNYIIIVPHIIHIDTFIFNRYGDRPVPEYKENLQKLFKKLKSSLPECLVIWSTNPAISHNPKGGVFIPGLDYLKDSMELHVLEANYYASKVAVENGHWYELKQLLTPVLWTWY